MNRSDMTRNASIPGIISKKGYVQWNHYFYGISESTGEMRGFFLQFLLLNPSLAAKEPVFGQHPYNKKRGIKPSYLRVSAGSFPAASADNPADKGTVLCSYHSLNHVKITGSPLVMESKDFLYSEEKLVGHVQVSDVDAHYPFMMTDAGSMSWDLEVSKAVSCHTGALCGKLCQRFRLLDSFWHGEGAKTFFRGKVILNGEIFHVTPDDSLGYADKRWGRDRNHGILTLSSGCLTSNRTGQRLRHSVLALNGCRDRFLFLPKRKRLLLQLTYMGEDFDFGMSPFSLYQCLWKTKRTNEQVMWRFASRNKDAEIYVSCGVMKEDLLAIRAETPDGTIKKAPHLFGAALSGTIKLYRRTNGEKELVDTLSIDQGYVEYQAK